jgi:hypothetical protein
MRRSGCSTALAHQTEEKFDENIKLLRGSVLLPRQVATMTNLATNLSTRKVYHALIVANEAVGFYPAFSPFP